MKAYLVKQGVAAERLEAKGYGPDRPVADNKTAAGRELNRRVELVISTAEKTETKVLDAPSGGHPYDLTTCAEPLPAAGDHRHRGDVPHHLAAGGHQRPRRRRHQPR